MRTTYQLITIVFMLGLVIPTGHTALTEAVPEDNLVQTAATLSVDESKEELQSVSLTKLQDAKVKRAMTLVPASALSPLQSEPAAKMSATQPTTTIKLNLNVDGQTPQSPNLDGFSALNSKLPPTTGTTVKLSVKELRSSKDVLAKVSFEGKTNFVKCAEWNGAADCYYKWLANDMDPPTRFESSFDKGTLITYSNGLQSHHKSEGPIVSANYEKVAEEAARMVAKGYTIVAFAEKQMFINNKLQKAFIALTALLVHETNPSLYYTELQPSTNFVANTYGSRDAFQACIDSRNTPTDCRRKLEANDILVPLTLRSSPLGGVTVRYTDGSIAHYQTGETTSTYNPDKLRQEVEEMIANGRTLLAFGTKMIWTQGQMRETYVAITAVIDDAMRP